MRKCWFTQSVRSSNIYRLTGPSANDWAKFLHNQNHQNAYRSLLMEYNSKKDRNNNGGQYAFFVAFWWHKPKNNID